MFEFIWPFSFLLLPLPWLWYRWLPTKKITLSQGLQVPFFSEIQKEIPASSLSLHRGLYFWGIVVCWILLVTALARPEWIGDPIAIHRSGRALMMAVDISGSMQIPDMQKGNEASNRLEAVKEVGKRFIEKRKGDRLGLILFGTKAYLQTPLTFDLQTISEMLQDASIGLAGTQTALGDAIGLAIKRLKEYPKANKALILLTDGADNMSTVSPLQAAEIAAKEGIRIYTIGIGSDELIIQGLFGPQVLNPANNLDEETLKKIAQTTHGLYFRAKDMDGLEKIYATLNRLEPVSKDTVLYRPSQALYPYPLSLAWLLSFLLVFFRMHPLKSLFKKTENP